MNSHILISKIVLSSLMIFSGCATLEERGDPIGRQGIVNHIYTSRELRYSPPSCLYSLMAEQMSFGKYVQIKVPYTKGFRITNAFVHPSMHTQIGDEVELTSVQCTRESIPEVKQVLHRRFKTVER